MNGVLRDRVRSISMNGYVGEPNNGVRTPGYRVYRKTSDLTDPHPSSLWVFVDEHENSINDGYFVTLMDGYIPRNPTAYTIGNFPASYHHGGCGFSFADGHAEVRKWLDGRTKPPVRSGGDFATGVGTPNNVDVEWLMRRTTAPIAD